VTVQEDTELPGYRPAAVEAAGDPGAEEQPALMLDADRTADIAHVVGQVFDGYIVCQSGEDLVLVDQHAAHERLLYERLVGAYREGACESQPLLIPVTVTVGGEGVEAVERSAELLPKLGWELEPFGDDAVVARAVPAIAADSDAAALVERMVGDLERTTADSAVSRIAEQLLATVACHAAVRVGQRLEREAARALLREVGLADFSACCPHGRPVARTMHREQVERLFGR